jgi:hypothetical protein
VSKAYPVQYEGEDGYCDWIQPQMDADYKLACCDCGLVHKMQFAVMRVKKDLGKGYKEIAPTTAGKFVVIFRASRDNRATGQVRRRKGRIVISSRMKENE